MNSKQAAFLLSALIGLIGANGCTKKEKPVLAAKPVEQSASGSRLSGKQLFKEKCALCHKVNGSGGEAGPDLTGIGRRKDAASLQKAIRNQRDINPTSLMPSFDNLPAADQQALVEYLTTLR